MACVCRPVTSTLPKPPALSAPQKRPPSTVVTCEPRTTTTSSSSNDIDININIDNQLNNNWITSSNNSSTKTNQCSNTNIEKVTKLSKLFNSFSHHSSMKCECNCLILYLSRFIFLFVFCCCLLMLEFLFLFFRYIETF